MMTSLIQKEVSKCSSEGIDSPLLWDGTFQDLMSFNWSKVIAYFEKKSPLLTAVVKGKKDFRQCILY